MRLYVSGPMTGYPDHNFPAFRTAAQELRNAGFEVLDPSELGVDPEFTWADYLRRDLALLLECYGVALLPGWEYSRGALLEIHVAQQLEMPIDTVSFWLSKDRIVFS